MVFVFNARCFHSFPLNPPVFFAPKNWLLNLSWPHFAHALIHIPRDRKNRQLRRSEFFEPQPRSMPTPRSQEHTKPNPPKHPFAVGNYLKTMGFLKVFYHLKPSFWDEKHFKTHVLWRMKTENLCFFLGKNLGATGHFRLSASF